MKRFHIHLSVNDLEKHITFYNQLFAADATVVHEDYAKWELDDPALNFAVSTRGHALGLNHLGFQAESDEVLTVLKSRVEAATGSQLEAAETSSCCYADSKKHWAIDPSGIAWEHYFTMGQTEYFSGNTLQSNSACCVPNSALGACC
jgi:hypothetical protein